jgi:hypothetical protein
MWFKPDAESTRSILVVLKMPTGPLCLADHGHTPMSSSFPLPFALTVLPDKIIQHISVRTSLISIIVPSGIWTGRILCLCGVVLVLRRQCASSTRLSSLFKFTYYLWLAYTTVDYGVDDVTTWTT